MRLRLSACVFVLMLPLSAAVALSPELGPRAAEAGATTAPAAPSLGSPTPGAMPTQDEPGAEADGVAEPAAPNVPAADAQESESDLPKILRAETELPEPVRKTRARLMEAARSGDMEQLRRLMEAQPETPSVSFGDPGDPIQYLKELSSDAEGREILAILLEVLESGFVQVEPGTPEELYVWPYFAQYPLEALTPPQLVELFTLLTAADYEDMRSYGSYTFFRVGIAPDGRWLFFLAGD
ncbi:MAG TPA: hypothetical protein VN240_00815 [Propylenella sp.]|nr:hypothetical protein [Propylenella sp.]